MTSHIHSAIDRWTRTGGRARVVLALALTLLAPQALLAKEPPPKVSEDGLELKTETKQRLVYVRPGATFTQYARVALLDCHVEFSKSWLRDYNNSVRDPAARISQKDLDRAKTDLSAQFKQIFTEELTRGGYEVTQSGGPDVLVLRPALINIAVSAPDLMTPGRSMTFAESSGQMTLYLELWDNTANSILARVIDTQGDSAIYGERKTSVSNKAAADRILKAWATELHKKLDLARGKSAEP
jgi:hypothetical protein